MTFEEALEEIKAEDEECRKVIEEAERNAEEYLRKSEDESSTERPIVMQRSEAMDDLISREELLYQLDQYAIASWWLDEDWYKEIVALIKRVGNVTI